VDSENYQPIQDGTEFEVGEGDGLPQASLDATLSGKVTLTTTLDDEEDKKQPPLDLSLSLEFDGSRTQVTVTNFPSVQRTKHTRLFDVVMTITLPGRPVGTYANGAITLPLTLHFEPKPKILLVLQPSDLDVTLTTAPPGSPVDAAGAVVLTGSGTFTGGRPLKGNTGNLTFTGTITPHP